MNQDSSGLAVAVNVHSGESVYQVDSEKED
jgi:hypothetical protein